MNSIEDIKYIVEYYRTDKLIVDEEIRLPQFSVFLKGNRYMGISKKNSKFIPYTRTDFILNKDLSVAYGELDNLMRTHEISELIALHFSEEEDSKETKFRISYIPESTPTPQGTDYSMFLVKGIRFIITGYENNRTTTNFLSKLIKIPNLPIRWRYRWMLRNTEIPEDEFYKRAKETPSKFFEELIRYHDKIIHTHNPIKNPVGYYIVLFSKEQNNKRTKMIYHLDLHPSKHKLNNETQTRLPYEIIIILLGRHIAHLHKITHGLFWNGVADPTYHRSIENITLSFIKRLDLSVLGDYGITEEDLKPQHSSYIPPIDLSLVENEELLKFFKMRESYSDIYRIILNFFSKPISKRLNRMVLHIDQEEVDALKQIYDEIEKTDIKAYM